MRCDARRLTLRPCLTQNSSINESARDGFLGRRRGLPSAVGVPSPHTSTPKPAALDPSASPIFMVRGGPEARGALYPYALTSESLFLGDAPSHKR